MSRKSFCVFQALLAFVWILSFSSHVYGYKSNYRLARAFAIPSMKENGVSLLERNILQEAQLSREARSAKVSHKSAESVGKKKAKEKPRRDIVTSILLPKEQSPPALNDSQVEQNQTTATTRPTTDVPAKPDFMLIEKIKEYEQLRDAARNSGDHNDPILVFFLSTCVSVMFTLCQML